MGNQKTSKQAISKDADIGVADEIRNVRGINWTAIFKERPDLEPPGYLETLQAVKNAKKQVENI